MAKMTDSERTQALLQWPWSPVRYQVFSLIDKQGFRGSFDQLCYVTQARKPRVSKVLMELFDAGLIDFLPAGTPADIVEGSSKEVLLIEDAEVISNV
jgi:hypothetical protein